MTDGSEDGGENYQVLSAILQSSLSESGDYEDPSSLLHKIPQPRQSPPSKPSRQRSDAPVRPYSIISGGQGSQKSLLGRGEVDSDSEGEGGSGDEAGDDETLRKPMVIRQSRKERLRLGSDAIEQSMGRIDIVGDIVQKDPPFSFKSPLKQQNGDGKSSDEIQEEGIYQGLKMTDAEKQRMGILPESIYMTLNLENWAEELENMSLKVQEAPTRVLSERVMRTDVGEHRRVVANRKAASGIPQRSQSQTSMQPPIAPRFRGSTVRAPPLPPLIQGSTEKERMVYGVVENLLRSEAAFLTSLTIAIDVYMKPLNEMAEGPTPILSKEQISNLFGRLPELVVHHQLFYTALTSRTMSWSPTQRVGDIFMSSFNTKEVIRHYSTFVNNFTLAMATLETCIKKKALFVQYLRTKYEQSATSLSLQGLLLKPIQRFPQYILFLQDLLKYTPVKHPDRVNLQIALARFEGIAIFLNEAKRRKEQFSVVQHLSSKVSGLPFQLLDGQRWLHRQDTVNRLLVRKTGVVKKKLRCLLLFNNILLCAATRLKNKKSALESSTGARDFRATEGVHYLCKWYAPLEKVELVEPDYVKDVWDFALPAESTEALEEYRELKASYRKLEHDYHTLTSITNLVSTLHENYPGLTVQAISNLIRVLQRKLARAKEEIKLLQPGRLDISIPSRDGSKVVHHTYMFRDEKTKQNWLNALRHAKLHLTKANMNAWAFADDTADEDFFEISHKLPLFVDSFRLNLLENWHSVECAAKVGHCSAWLSSGDRSTAQITVVECVTPHPFIVECFTLDCTRIIDMVYIAAETKEGGPERRLSATMKRGAILTTIPLGLDTIWMGSQCGKLLIFHATTSEGTRRCISTVQLQDSITCIQHANEKVFVATALGDLVVFKKGPGGWIMGGYETVAVSEDSIRSMCLVRGNLWIACKNTCFIMNTVTFQIEGLLESVCCEGATVNKIVSCGSGVWLCYRGCPHIELYHSGTRNTLQHIDLRAAMKQIIARYRLQEKVPSLVKVHASCLMASSGYLWIGTSLGAVLVYRIPHLEGVPLTSGKPYLAMLCHHDSVRVLLTVKTLSTMTDTRVSQFISDEHHRNIGEGAEVLTTDDEEMVDGVEGGDGRRGEGGERKVNEEEEEQEEEEDRDGEEERERNGGLVFNRSLTPSLLDPSLIASVDFSLSAPPLNQDGGSTNPSSEHNHQMPSACNDDEALGECSSLDRKGMFRRLHDNRAELNLELGKDEVTEAGRSDANHSGRGTIVDRSALGENDLTPLAEELLISIEDAGQFGERHLESGGGGAGVDETGDDDGGGGSGVFEWVKKEVRSYSQIGEDDRRFSIQTEGDLMNFESGGAREGRGLASLATVDIPFVGDFAESLISSGEFGEETEPTPNGGQDNEDSELHEAQDQDHNGGGVTKEDPPAVSRRDDASSTTLQPRSREEEEEEEEKEEDFATMRRIPTPELDGLEDTMYDLVSPKDDGTLTEREEKEGEGGQRRQGRARPYEKPTTLERTGPIPPLSAVLSPTETLAQALPRSSLVPQEGAIFVLTVSRGLLDLRPPEEKAATAGRSSSTSSSSPYVLRRSGQTAWERDESFVVAYEIEQ